METWQISSSLGYCIADQKKKIKLKLDRTEETFATEGLIWTKTLWLAKYYCNEIDNIW